MLFNSFGEYYSKYDYYGHGLIFSPDFVTRLIYVLSCYVGSIDEKLKLAKKFKENIEKQAGA